MSDRFRSRKFWVAVAGLVAGVVFAVTGTDVSAEQVLAVMLPIVAYIFGQGAVDAAAARQDAAQGAVQWRAQSEALARELFELQMSLIESTEDEGPIRFTPDEDLFPPLDG